MRFLPLDCFPQMIPERFQWETAPVEEWERSQRFLLNPSPSAQVEAPARRERKKAVVPRDSEGRSFLERLRQPSNLSGARI
jgi:hypothetical protein